MAIASKFSTAGTVAIYCGVRVIQQQKSEGQIESKAVQQQQSVGQKYQALIALQTAKHEEFPNNQ